MPDDPNRYSPPGDWTGMDGELCAFISGELEKTLDAYRSQPKLLEEHANLEEDTARGGYAHRQLFELIQNSADALVSAPAGGRIEIRLTGDHLYCADDGRPIDSDGVTALMFSRMSPKRGTSEIGRFGLGFKSVLGVTDAPEFFSRSGSFCFDRENSRVRILEAVRSASHYPTLRLPDPIDPRKNRDKDDILRELMDWANNIVRLPLKPGVRDDLCQQVREFPKEFLLFVKHVHSLTLKDEPANFKRNLELLSSNDEFLLADGNETSQWKMFNHMHRLSSEALADRRSLDDGEDVPVCWTVPLDHVDHPRQFWAFFPTMTTSLVAGILNAPWKTNEDRQNLLPGPYNDELIKSAAKMIVGKLSNLAIQEDPARHLDALPRRHEAGDSEQAELLRNEILSCLCSRNVVPNQDGSLRPVTEISYPPKDMTRECIERWEAYPGRPRDWLHHSALTRNRLAAIDRLFSQQSSSSRFPFEHKESRTDKWLEALVTGRNSEDIVEASKAAVQTAALMPPEKLCGEYGSIVLTAGDELREPDPERVFLPDEAGEDGRACGPDLFVHPQLASDPGTRAALEKLGIRQPSPESAFGLIAEEVLDSYGEPTADILLEFWERSREVGDGDKARDIILEHHDWKSKPLIRTRSGGWNPIHSALLPGEIVPGDGSRDDEAAVDMMFHGPDIELLRGLGVTEAPREIESSVLSSEPWFRNYLSERRDEFTSLPLPSNPRYDYLNFIPATGSGPLEVLAKLSDEGRALYTEALLSLDATYTPWTMEHDTQEIYPPLRCEPPAVCMLRREGRVQTPRGIVPLEDALGPQPENAAALRALLALPKSDGIRQAFDLQDPAPEFIGEEDPIPLTDVWPGLEEHLGAHGKPPCLVRCERILDGTPSGAECVFSDPNVYLARTDTDDEYRELRLVSRELSLDLGESQLKEVLLYRTRQEVKERRDAVRNRLTDAERLLEAAGERALRGKLPGSLLAILEGGGVSLTGIGVAEAAIATYHTGALKEYRDALAHLDPPERWAGSARAVEFVRSLGFPPEWAGERNRRRSPFVEVEGPYSLPGLHGYQETIVGRVRDMLCGGQTEKGARRGMISMPTGSGKTRVAVEAVVRAMCGDGFGGGVLWVADRDELCEQAVEAWRQVWSGVGRQGLRLRVSRMWAGQPAPVPTSGPHVVVATIQTLSSRLEKQPDKYGFLKDFSLVIFDEAHRSIAPTYTSAMREIGLTWRRQADEPFLIGLTATPYRGYSEQETAWLANRYGANRLDAGAFGSDDSQDVVSELQGMGVIARADHETIEGGEFSLNADELQRMQQSPWLPRSVEDRIAEDAERTRRIIEAYEEHIRTDWPALIFATSVEHAKTVAALLNARGIRSRSVSGSTETAVRRKIVEEFRCGEIRALVNYGVFREGFDAPKTRAIIVARPVYSPNLYFQMIGRGLRGVKNGGNDRCLILNVRDNIENFQRALAFSDLDWLWD